MQTIVMISDTYYLQDMVINFQNYFIGRSVGGDLFSAVSLLEEYEKFYLKGMNLEDSYLILQYLMVHSHDYSFNQLVGYN